MKHSFGEVHAGAEMTFLLTFLLVFATLVATTCWRAKHILVTTPAGAYSVVALSWLALAVTALLFSYLIHAIAWFLNAN